MDAALQLFCASFGFVAIFATLPGTIELAFLTIPQILPIRKIHSKNVHDDSGKLFKTAVLIPAHNEELTLSRTIESLKACEGEFDLIVIADNCTDKTAEIAKNLCVRVLERHDNASFGKHFALQFGFSSLLIEGYDIFIVIDADTVVQSHFIRSIQGAFQQGALAVQGQDLLDENDVTPFQRLSCLAFRAHNYIRPKGREWWGISAGILGNGFALSRQILLTVPFNIVSIVEDVVYHLQIVKAGYRVRFIEEAKATAMKAPSISVEMTQKIRWEGGRWSLLKKMVPGLIKDILKGNTSLLEPVLDMLLPPLFLHTLLLLLLLAIPGNIFKLYAALGLGVLFLHLLAAIRASTSPWKDVLALCLSPFYLLWKLTVLLKIIKSGKKDSIWIPTQRQ